MKETLGRYKIIKEIGRGAMGTVYQGYDPKIDRIVALKTIRKDRLAESREVEDLVTRFQKEVRAAGKLVHPNIIIIYDTGEDEETAYIAMEYIEGDTLENMIQKGIRFPLEKIVDIIEQTCDGLEYTHRQGIVHRDLKPSNIMLIGGERVKITDFGISKAVGASSSPLTQAGILLGTPSYMSPEQIAGKEIDGRSDLFSLGIILYQLLTEEKPFVGDTIPTLLYNIVNRDPIPLSHVDSGISPLYDAVIAKAMAKNPDNRYQTAKDFAEDVKRASRGEALMEGPSIDATMTVAGRVPEEVPSQRRKYGLLAGIGVLVLIVVVGAYYWMHRTPRPTEEEGRLGVPVEPPKKFGRVVVNSDPPDAQVFLDGKDLGSLTPAVIEKVPAGEKHEIRVVKKGFKPWAETVEPEDDQSVTVQASLERFLTTIVVKSTPRGASVFLDGVEQKELTPTVIQRVPAGERYEIRVVKKGFKPWAETVEPEDDQSVPVQASLERFLTTIVVKSTPSGAAVFLDGKRLKEPTPTVIQKVTAGEKHEIRVVKKGFKPWAETVEPEDDQSVPVEASLERLLTTIVVKSTPSGAAVFLDGAKQKELTPTVIQRVPVGKRYEIRVSKKGFKPWAETVEPEDDRRVPVEASLERLLSTIVVKSTPSGAAVFLDGAKHKELTPTVIQGVPVGRRYEIRVSKKGFKPWAETVEPEDDRSVPVEASLERLLSTIVVKSTPSGAAVFLDGAKHKELTPTVIQGVPVGRRYEIRVSKKGFKPWAETVEPEDDRSVPVEASLERLLSTIVVKSTPSGAAVFLDGAKHKELTPTVIQRIPAGEKHEIRVEKEGFKPWAETVEPEDDRSVSVEALLERLLSTIVVKSTPSGAAVFLDDKEVPGSTPLELRDISADDVHRIAVRKQGYAAGVQTVTLKPGERKEVEVALKPLFGEIRLTSDPPGAKVYLNDRDVARKTPARLSGLSPGKYKVKLKKEGYRVWEEEVVVKASESLDLPGVRLQEAFGKLNLHVSPWAEVYYKGKKLGDTPLARIPFKEGSHEIILRNPVLKIEKAITVKIEADKVTRQSVDLMEGIKGKLKIKVTPWAHVYVDGKPRGTTPLKPLELTPGEHIVMVKNEKLAVERSFRVVIKPNEVHSMEVDLLKKE